MRTIPKERILRVNCPGFGVNANFNLGSAKPLDEYSAIIVNPVSIAHLFDKDPEVVRRIDQALEEGHTTFTVDDDLLLRNIAAEAESRIDAYNSGTLKSIPELEAYSRLGISP